MCTSGNNADKADKIIIKIPTSKKNSRIKTSKNVFLKKFLKIQLE